VKMAPSVCGIVQKGTPFTFIEATVQECPLVAFRQQVRGIVTNADLVKPAFTVSLSLIVICNRSIHYFGLEL